MNIINTLLDLNWISVLIAFLIYFFLGAMWFTLFFKKPYARSLGKVDQLPDKPAPIFIIGPAICTLVITIATAILIYLLDLSQAAGAISFALLVGIGYLGANTVNIAINPNIPNPILYGIISGAYHLTGMILISLVIVWMKS